MVASCALHVRTIRLDHDRASNKGGDEQTLPRSERLFITPSQRVFVSARSAGGRRTSVAPHEMSVARNSTESGTPTRPCHAEPGGDVRAARAQTPLPSPSVAAVPNTAPYSARRNVSATPRLLRRGPQPRRQVHPRELVELPAPAAGGARAGSCGPRCPAPARPGAGSSPAAPGRRRPGGSWPTPARPRRSRTRAATPRPTPATPAAARRTSRGSCRCRGCRCRRPGPPRGRRGHVLGVALGGREAELQHRHAREPERLAHRGDRRRDHAEVLGDHRQGRPGRRVRRRSGAAPGPRFQEPAEATSASAGTAQ